MITIEIDIDPTLANLNRIELDIWEAGRDALADTALLLEAKMAEKVSEGIPPPLKPATVKWKLSHSGHGGSTPLIATSQLLGQITSLIDIDGSAKVGVIGSRAEIAVHHEYGAPAANIPERSFERSVANEQTENIKKIFIEKIVSAIQV